MAPEQYPKPPVNAELHGDVAHVHRLLSRSVDLRHSMDQMGGLTYLRYANLSEYVAVELFL